MLACLLATLARLSSRLLQVGRYAYYINLVNYLAFVTALTMYVVDNPVLESMQSGYELTSVGNVCQFWILVWAGLAIAEDLFKLVTGGPRAFLQVSELLDIGAYTSALLLVLPLGGPRWVSHASSATRGVCLSSRGPGLSPICAMASAHTDLGDPPSYPGR